MSERSESRRAPLNLHLQQLAYLREVARCRTWSEAAERLHVSQPALSQALAELERRLDVPLFEREGRRRRLSAQGEEVVGYARRVLAEAEEMARRLERHRRGEVGELRVGMIDAASLYLLPQSVHSFRQEHPDVQLRVVVASSSDLRERLRRYELDLAFLIGDAEDDLLAEEIVREPLYLYAPPGERGRPDDADWVLYPGESRTREAIDAGLAERGLRPRVIMESGNPQVLRQMVALGFGWSVLPAAVAERGAEPLRRRRGGAMAVRTLRAVRRPRLAADPLVKDLVGRARRAARRRG